MFKDGENLDRYNKIVEYMCNEQWDTNSLCEFVKSLGGSESSPAIVIEALDTQWGNKYMDENATAIAKFLVEKVIWTGNDSTKDSSDMVNHPSHYTSGKYEVIEVIKDKLSTEQFEGYCIGNVMKYIMRYQNKNGLEDLQKGMWYLNYLIEYKKNLEEEK